MDSTALAAARLLFDTRAAAASTTFTPQLESLLRNNKAPLAVLADRYPDDIAGSPVEPVVRREQARRDRHLRGFTEVAEAWAERSIASVLIKSPGFFPYTSDNVDVLVAPRRFDAAREALVNLGYVEIPLLREPHKHYFRHTHDRDLPAIHLHSAVAWINAFMDADEVLGASRCDSRNAALRFPSPDHAAVITTAHWFYEDKQLSLRDLFHMREALEAGADPAATRAFATRHGWQDGWDTAMNVTSSVAEALGVRELRDAVPRGAHSRLGRAVSFPDPRAEGTTMPVPVRKAPVKVMQLKKTLADPTIGAATRAREVAGLLGYAVLVKSPLPLRRTPPLVVAVSGIDGSGKTTTAAAVAARLREAGLPVAQHWMRPGSSGGLDAIKSLLGRRRPTPAATAAGQDRGPQPPRRDVHATPRLWRLVVASDYVVRLWPRWAAARARGGIHIFDRYSVDAAADLLVRYGGCEGLILRTAPPPDLAILLRADPDTAVLRGTTPIEREALEAAADVYERNERRFDVLFDSSADGGAVVAAVTKAVSARVGRRR